ncbi:hypothetical protein FHG87_009222 [Trinorchestia longiramus]|nr:hypothetical protein FHG87_009222 [Trinorchestia longiramus]
MQRTRYGFRNIFVHVTVIYLSTVLGSRQYAHAQVSDINIADRDDYSSVFTFPDRGAKSQSQRSARNGEDIFADLPIRTKKNVRGRNPSDPRVEYIGRLPADVAFSGRAFSNRDFLLDGIRVNEDELSPPPHGPVRPPVRPYSLSWVREGRMKSNEVTDKIKEREDRGDELLTEVTEYGINETNYLIRIHEPSLYNKGYKLMNSHPGLFLAAFNKQKEQSLALSRFGYAALRASEKLSHQWISLTTSPTFQVDFLHNITYIPDGCPSQRHLHSRFQLSRQQALFGLEQVSVENTALFSACPFKSDDTAFRRPCPAYSVMYRTLDGSCNNADHPEWGAALRPFARFLPPDYSSQNSSLQLTNIEGTSTVIFQLYLCITLHLSSSSLLLFIVCWSPYIVFDLLQVFGYVPRTPKNVALATFIQSLAPLNSAANPLIYCLFSTHLCKNIRNNFDTAFIATFVFLNLRSPNWSWKVSTKRKCPWLQHEMHSASLLAFDGAETAYTRIHKPYSVCTAVFIVCWSPYIVFDLLQVFGYVPRTPKNVALATFIQSLAPLNSAANPLIYCLFSTHLCKNIRELLVVGSLGQLSCLWSGRNQETFCQPSRPRKT